MIIKEDYSTVKVYAEAIYNVAKEQKKVDSLLKEINKALSAFDSFQQLVDVLLAPHIDRKEKHSLVANTLQKKFSELFCNIFDILIEANRINILKDVFIFLIDYHKQINDIYTSYIYTAFDLSNNQKELIQKSLQKFLKRQLEIEYIKDPKLIGGIKFVINDMIIDFSLRGELEKLQKKLENCFIA